MSLIVVEIVVLMELSIMVERIIPIMLHGMIIITDLLECFKKGNLS